MANRREEEMSRIGGVIEELRNRAGMSRKILCDNICSEKYLYLIEKGKRIPSMNITRLFSDRLGIDLFKYSNYLDCKNPIEIEAAMSMFYKCRRESDILALKEINDYAMTLPDFQTAPWSYEVELNQIAYRVLVDGKYRESIKDIEDIIQKMDPKYADSTFRIFYYVLLSTCYQMDMDLKRAKDANTVAYEIIFRKDQIEKYVTVLFTVMINKITLLYLSKEYDEVISEAKLLGQYQKQANVFDSLHHSFIYLAFAYYHKGMEEEGIAWFMKCLSIMSFNYRPLDMYYFSEYELFDVLINDQRLPKGIIGEVKRLYNLS